MQLQWLNTPCACSHLHSDWMRFQDVIFHLGTRSQGCNWIVWIITSWNESFFNLSKIWTFQEYCGFLYIFPLFQIFLLFFRYFHSLPFSISIVRPLISTFMQRWSSFAFNALFHAIDQLKDLCVEPVAVSVCEIMKMDRCQRWPIWFTWCSESVSRIVVYNVFLSFFD